MAAVSSEDADEEAQTNLTVKQIVTRFILVSIGIIAVSILATQFTDKIAQKHNLGAGLAGAEPGQKCLSVYTRPARGAKSGAGCQSGCCPAGAEKLGCHLHRRRQKTANYRRRGPVMRKNGQKPGPGAVLTPLAREIMEG